MALPAQLDAVSAWHTIRTDLQQRISDSAFEIWLAPLELDSFDGNLLLLRAPPATEKWLAGRFCHWCSAARAGCWRARSCVVLP